MDGLSAWQDAPPGLCVYAESCGQALDFEHKDDLHACDHFVDSEHLLGNITQQPLADMVNSKRQLAFGWIKYEKTALTYLACPFWFRGRGGCARKRDKMRLNNRRADDRAF